MSRFVLRYRGKGPKPADVAGLIRATPGVRMIDDAGRMMLVDASEHALRGLVDGMQLNDWLVAPERSYGPPDPRPTPRADSSAAGE